MYNPKRNDRMRLTSDEGGYISGWRPVVDVIRTVMFIHAILDLGGAIVLYFAPHIISVLAPGVPQNEYALRIIGSAFFAIAWVSARAALYTRPKMFLQLLEFKAVWATFAWIGCLITILVEKHRHNPVPIFAYITLGTFALGSLLWWSFLFIINYFIKDEVRQRKRSDGRRVNR